MVGDVTAYPEFIPWISSIRVYNQKPAENGAQVFDADVSVGFKLLSERFSTRVTRQADDHSVHMGYLRGPFKRLDGKWRFTPVEGGTRIDFDMDMDFKNPFLAAILRANFDRAVEKLMAVFEARANQLYARL